MGRSKLKKMAKRPKWMKWIKWTTRRKKGKKVTNKRLKEKDTHLSRSLFRNNYLEKCL